MEGRVGNPDLCGWDGHGSSGPSDYFLSVTKGPCMCLNRIWKDSGLQREGKSIEWKGGKNLATTVPSKEGVTSHWALEFSEG